MASSLEYAPGNSTSSSFSGTSAARDARFARNGDTTPDVNLRRIAQDGNELVRHICDRLRKRKVIVLGHSWGSIVAVTMVNSRPELFAAHVGTGQVASWKSAVQAQVDYLLARARANNDHGDARTYSVGAVMALSLEASITSFEALSARP